MVNRHSSIPAAHPTAVTRRSPSKHPMAHDISREARVAILKSVQNEITRDVIAKNPRLSREKQIEMAREGVISYFAEGKDHLGLIKNKRG